MGGSSYVAELSEDQTIERLNNVLGAIEEKHSFLWKGNPCLIEKYASPHRDKVKKFDVDSGYCLHIQSDMAHSALIPFEKVFDIFGIVKKGNEYNFYLGTGGTGDNSVITDAKGVCKHLGPQFDIHTEYNLDEWTDDIKKTVRNILETESKKDLEARLAELFEGF